MTDATCSVAACERKPYARGWCEPHYARWRRHGSLHDKRAERVDPRRRFERRVNRNGEAPPHRRELGKCWLWTGPANSSGYGSFAITPDPAGHVGAHVAALILDGQEVPDGMPVDHLCRIRLCVRPSHLEVVTIAENVRRSLPFRHRPSSCRYGHPLTPDNIMRSQGPRACRTCFKEMQRRYRQKRKGQRLAS